MINSGDADATPHLENFCSLLLKSHLVHTPFFEEIKPCLFVRIIKFRKNQTKHQPCRVEDQ